ncbi:MAG: adenine phosphoribosyltransferase [Erysipelotrichaceae bacterium]|nr:adenine phosphoribosyltransferase [Erysipelotrichaceae bacterium]
MELKDYIRIQENFPREGISFKDISPLLENPKAFAETIDRMKEIAEKWSPDLIVGPESRGFIFAAPLAIKMNKGFLMARKAGKLPGKALSVTYDLEYGRATLEIPAFAVNKGTRIVIVDDLLATGGTLQALEKLFAEAGAEVVGIITAIELTSLKGRDNLKAPYETLISFPR